MSNPEVPVLLDEEINSYFENATNSNRKRSHKILHDPGDYLNKVFNFVLEDSYMTPHMHPSSEKVEHMYLVSGEFALIYFDDCGEISDSYLLRAGLQEKIQVKPYAWHTYVMLSDKTIIYETMEGVYHPETWKKMAPWAPVENSQDAMTYLQALKDNVKNLNKFHA